MPDDFERLKIEEESASADGTDDDKKRQKRGGKGLLRVKKKEDVPKKICVSRAARGKKKSVTVVTGLSTFGKSWRRILPIPKSYTPNQTPSVRIVHVHIKKMKMCQVIVKFSNTIKSFSHEIP